MFQITPEDIDKTFDTLLVSKHPLKIKVFPAKEKRKYILVAMLSHLFEPGKMYHEKDVSMILQTAYDDHVTLRRYLIDYKFLDRKTDGSAYWLAVDLKDYEAFKV